MRGWLLDIHPLEEDHVCIWIKDEGGHVFLHKLRWRPKIYAAGSIERLIELAKRLSPKYDVDFVEKFIKPGGKADTVLEVKVPFGWKKKVAKTILDLGNHTYYQVYNVDLPSMQEFLYEHELYPTAYIELYDDHFKIVDSIEDLDYSLSWLRSGYLDVKIDSRGVVSDFRDIIEEVILRYGGEKIVLDQSEDSILEDLSKLLDKLDLDIIITDGGDSFLIPYLYYRAKVNNVKLKLGRIEDLEKLKVKSTSYFSYGRVYRKFSGVKLKGRLHIDSSNSMLYNETGLEGVIEVARTTRIPIQDAARYTIGSCMTSLQYYQAHRLKVLLPWSYCKTVYMTAWRLNKADRGGLIIDVKPRVYWNIGELDFKSLYPMLMYKYNISGETVNCECCKEENFKIPEIGYHVCKKWRGVVPRAIELPLKKRLQYKQLYQEVGDSELRRIFKQRSDALKWILVTAFGYLGFRKAKFGSREAHLAVCALAREVLLKAIRIAEEMGFEVVHGIVDSLWVHREEACDEDYLKLAEKIERELCLPVSYEGRYKWIIFLPSKSNLEKPVNNRYFGVFVDGRVKYRGLEIRRRDMPRIVKEMQYDMIMKLAEADSPIELREKVSECFEIYKKYAERIILGQVSAEDLAITRVLSMDLEEYSTKIKHVIAAKKLRSIGVKIDPGQPITYILARPATPIQLYEGFYNSEEYLKLLKSAFKTIISFLD